MINEQHGMVQPQAIDLEVAVLGALMLEREAIEDVVDILSAEMFYDNRHREIYRSILELRRKSQPIDLLTVTQNIKTRGKSEEVGGLLYVADLTDKIASAANIRNHSLIILEKYLLREHIKNCNKSIKLAYMGEHDTFEVLNTAQKELEQLTDKDVNVSSESKAIGDIVSQNIKDREAAINNKEELGITTGFNSIDRKCYRYIKGEQYIIAARPGMGKTSYALCSAIASAREGKPVQFFSLEMSKSQLTTRCESIISGLSYKKIVSGRLNQQEQKALLDAQAELYELPIFINDKPGLHIDEIKAISRKKKKTHGIEEIFIDYLQLINGPFQNDQNHKYEYISQETKNLAKELDVPVISLSQLSRNVESRKDKKPMLSDLRNSGGIEQAADTISFIYRPYYYFVSQGDTSFQYDEHGNSLEDYCEILTLKNRNGDVGTVNDIKFIGECTKFYEPEQTPF